MIYCLLLLGFCSPATPVALGMGAVSMLCFSAPLSRSAALSLPLVAPSLAPKITPGMGQGGVGLPFSLKADQEIFFHACHKVGHDANLMAKSVKGEWTGESGEELGLVSCGLSQRVDNGSPGMWPGKDIPDEGHSTGSSELCMVFKEKGEGELGFLCFFLCLRMSLLGTWNLNSLAQTWVFLCWKEPPLPCDVHL